MQLKTGTLLHGGTYRILNASEIIPQHKDTFLGQGSFGITYLAEHTSLGRKVAIKEFFMKELNSRGDDGSITGMSDGSLSYNYGQKFKKEAINLSQLDHPNIVRVTDSFEDNGTYYYVMDYIEGENLNDYLKHNAVSEQEAVNIITDVAKALQYMHDTKHMLHLDLKPGNIMRRASDGHIFLIDFGLSKHYSNNGQPETSTTIGLGTVGYAPIEQSNQAKNGEFRPTIDVYALGATLYKLLIRETPPPASDIVSDDELVEDKLRTNGITGNIIDVVVNAMLPNVRKRTQTVKAFLRSLDNFKIEVSVHNEDTILTSITSNREEQKSSKTKEQETLNIQSKGQDKEKETRGKGKVTIVTLIICISLVVIIVGLVGEFFWQTSSKSTNTTFANDSNEINYVENDTIYLKDIQRESEIVLDSKFDKYVKGADKTVSSHDYMVYTGDVKNGLPEGNGIAVFNDGRKYVGSFKNGLFNDEHGVLTDNEGVKYEASFVNGFLAKGKYTITEKGKIIEVYEGIFVHDAPCTGTFYDGKGNVTIKIEHGQIIWFKDDDAIDNTKIENSISENIQVEQSNSESTSSATDQDRTEIIDNSVYENVEQMPEYPGGLSAYYAFLNNNLKYPSSAQEDGIQGRVVVSFVVEKNGTLSNFSVVNSVSPDLDKEALRVVKHIPSFNPGKKQGKEVRVKMSLPITFRLQ